MSGRPDERERFLPRGVDCDPRGERCGLEGRRRRDGVVVEPRDPLDRTDRGDVLRGVAEQELVLGRRATYARVGEMLQQDGQSLRAFGMVAGGVEARERRVRQDVDRTISSSSSIDATPGRARPSR